MSTLGFGINLILSEKQPILLFFRKIFFLNNFFFFFKENNGLVLGTLLRPCKNHTVLDMLSAMSLIVRVHVIADPASNSCRDPGTPAYGIPVMAQGFQVRMTHHCG